MRVNKKAVLKVLNLLILFYVKEFSPELRVKVMRVVTNYKY